MAATNGERRLSQSLMTLLGAGELSHAPITVEKFMVAANDRVYDVMCNKSGLTYQVIAEKKDVEHRLEGADYIQDVLHYLSAS